MVLAHAAELGICLFLVLATLAVFGRTAAYEFVAYDDDAYVYANRHVKPGLTLDGIKWAFTRAHSSNWHPLTWLSHMLDCQFYGQWAGGHHLTSVFLHAAACVVLFLALRRLTGATLRSGMVAALFCLHPLHVESVAWVSERKDVLSGLFFALTLWAYAGYTRSRSLPGPHPDPLPAGEGKLGRPHPGPLPAGEGKLGRPHPNPLPAGEGDLAALTLALSRRARGNLAALTLTLSRRARGDFPSHAMRWSCSFSP